MCDYFCFPDQLRWLNAEMMHHQPALPIYTVFFTSVIVFIPSSVSGRIFYTYLGTSCLDDCRLYGSEYKCTTITEEGVIDTLYCSPENNLDHKGNKCTSPCWKESKNYWCKTGWRWGYCGHVKEDQNHYTKNGEMCSDTCGMHGKSYYWCKTKQGWDYCSIKKNMDYKGNACHQDHPCGKHQESFYWCKTVKGGWGYCGPVEPNTLQQKNLKVFQEDLLLNKSEAFVQSYNNSVWGDLTDISEQVSRRWGLCIDYRKIKPSRGSKRLIDGGEVIDLDIDQGKRVATLFIVCPGQNAIADGRTWSNETQHLIALWNNGYLSNQSKSTLPTSKNLRIALQGLPYIEGQQYYNLEIHLWQNATVSQILIPRNPPIPIPDRHVRRAFLLSFYYQGGVIVDIKPYWPRLG
ncbi:hypothetical protein MHYP_G00251250 [Metynnis hypsauchen]